VMGSRVTVWNREAGKPKKHDFPGKSIVSVGWEGGRLVVAANELPSSPRTTRAWGLWALGGVALLGVAALLGIGGWQLVRIWKR